MKLSLIVLLGLVAAASVTAQEPQGPPPGPPMGDEDMMAPPTGDEDMMPPPMDEDMHDDAPYDAGEGEWTEGESDYSDPCAPQCGVCHENEAKLFAESGYAQAPCSAECEDGMSDECKSCAADIGCAECFQCYDAEWHNEDADADGGPCEEACDVCDEDAGEQECFLGDGVKNGPCMDGLESDECTECVERHGCTACLECHLKEMENMGADEDTEGEGEGEWTEGEGDYDYGYDEEEAAGDDDGYDEEDEMTEEDEMMAEDTGAEAEMAKSVDPADSAAQKPEGPPPPPPAPQEEMDPEMDGEAEATEGEDTGEYEYEASGDMGDMPPMPEEMADMGDEAAGDDEMETYDDDMGDEDMYEEEMDKSVGIKTFAKRTDIGHSAAVQRTSGVPVLSAAAGVVGFAVGVALTTFALRSVTKSTHVDDEDTDMPDIELAERTNAQV